MEDHALELVREALAPKKKGLKLGSEKSAQEVTDKVDLIHDSERRTFLPYLQIAKKSLTDSNSGWIPRKARK